MAEVNPTPQDVASKVPELRKQFKEKYAAAISGGEYDARDLKRLETDDAYARCFLRTLLSKGDVSKSLPLIDTAFKFRREFQINDLNDAYFPQEVKDKKGIYYKGKDINGHPIVYLRSKENSADDAQAVKYLKQYIAYTFEQHHSKHPEVMVVALVDMSGAGMSNMNMDISKFILSCFSTYFPSYLAYMINYEMPFILNAVWTLITPFLNSDQKKKLVMASKKDITKYISEDNLWDHMKKH